MPQPHNFQMMEDTFEGSVLENSVWTANQQKSHATILSRNCFEKGKYIMLESGKKKKQQTKKQTLKNNIWTSFSCVLPTSYVGYNATKPMRRVICWYI